MSDVKNVNMGLGALPVSAAGMADENNFHGGRCYYIIMRYLTGTASSYPVQGREFRVLNRIARLAKISRKVSRTMSKRFFAFVPALLLTGQAYATDVKLPDNTPASVTVQTPCTSESYREYETCISAILSLPSNRGGDIDIRAIESLLPKDIQKAAIISGITAAPVVPMTVSLKHYDDRNIIWSSTDTPLDHIIIPNNGTYQVVLTTADGGKTWGIRVIIEQPGSIDQ